MGLASIDKIVIPLKLHCVPNKETIAHIVETDESILNKLYQHRFIDLEGKSLAPITMEWGSQFNPTDGTYVVVIKFTTDKYVTH